jgi:hypothetical protein
VTQSHGGLDSGSPQGGHPGGEEGDEEQHSRSQPEDEEIGGFDAVQKAAQETEELDAHGVEVARIHDRKVDGRPAPLGWRLTFRGHGGRRDVHLERTRSARLTDSIPGEEATRSMSRRQDRIS